MILTKTPHVTSQNQLTLKLYSRRIMLIHVSCIPMFHTHLNPIINMLSLLLPLLHLPRSIGSSVADGLYIPSPPHFDNTRIYPTEQSLDSEESITSSTKTNISACNRHHIQKETTFQSILIQKEAFIGKCRHALSFQDTNDELLLDKNVNYKVIFASKNKTFL